MSQSDRSGKFATIILFLVVIPLATMWVWDISAKHALNTQNTNTTTHQYSENAEQDIQRNCVASSPFIMAKCIQRILEESEESKRAVKSLQAQKEMAEWAFWMLMASIGTGAITGLGVWFVRNTLKATVEANQLQSPPRIHVRQVSIEPTLDANGRINGELILINSGRFPGTVTRAELCFHFGRELPAKHPTAELNRENIMNTCVDPPTIDPGEGRWWKFNSKEVPVPQKWPPKNVKADPLHVLGVLEFKDTYGVRTTTLFCRRYCPTTGRFEAVIDEDYEYTT